MIYNTQSYFSVRLATGLDLSTATVTRILYKKPNGTTGYWTATTDAETLVYAVEDGDIDQSGVWEFQGYVEVGGRKGFGETVQTLIGQNIQ